MYSAKFVWPQGEDLRIQLRYKEGSGSAAKAVNLSAGYAARMDLVLPSGGSVLYTASTDNGSLVLGTAGDNPNISIVLPRALTLPGGALENTRAVAYDLFLRNTATDIQIRVLEGTISIDRSRTLWS